MEPARFAFDPCLSPLSVSLILFSVLFLSLASACPFGAPPTQEPDP